MPIIVQVKDKVIPEIQKGTVCQIKCESGESYMGGNGHPKIARMRELVANIRYRRTDTSGIARHASSKKINTLHAKTLPIKRSWRKRTIRGTLEIKIHNSAMSRGAGKATISQIWAIAVCWDCVNDAAFV